MAIFPRPNREYLDLFYHFFVKNSTSYLPIGLYPCAAGQSTLGGKRWRRRLRRDAGKPLGGRLRRRRDWRSRAGAKAVGESNQGVRMNGSTTKKVQRTGKIRQTFSRCARGWGPGREPPDYLACGEGYSTVKGKSTPPALWRVFGLSRRVSLIPTRWLPGAWGRGRTARGRRRGLRPGYAG